MEGQIYIRFEDQAAVVMKSSIFCDKTLCSPLKVNWRFGRNMCSKRLCLPPPVSCLAYFPFLKMEATCCSETSVILSTGYTALYPRSSWAFSGIFLCKHYVLDSFDKRRTSGSWNSAVGIVTDYWSTQGSMFESHRVKNFFFSTSCRPALVPTQPPIQWIREALCRD
jgi:hypothetical protein